MDERQERISLRAYEIWERLGRPKERQTELWLEAERQIDAEMRDAQQTKSGSQEGGHTRSAA